MKVRKIAKGQFRVTVYIKISQTQDSGAPHPVMVSSHNTHPSTRSMDRRTGLIPALHKGQRKRLQMSVQLQAATSPVTVATATIKPETFVCVRFGDITSHHHKINKIEEQSISTIAENRSCAVVIKRKWRERHFLSFLFNEKIQIIFKCSIC